MALLLLFSALVAMSLAQTTTIDMPFFGGATSQPLSGYATFYSTASYIVLCTGSCDSYVQINVDKYDQAGQTTAIGVGVADDGDDWSPYPSGYEYYFCDIDSTTARCSGHGEDGYSSSTTFSDVTSIPVTLTHVSSYVPLPETVTVTQTLPPLAGSSSTTLWVPAVNSYYDDYVYASVVAANEAATTLAFGATYNLDFQFPAQTLTVGPSTWNLLEADVYNYDSTRSLDCSFKSLQTYSSVAICTVSNGGADAYNTGTDISVYYDPTSVVITVTAGIDKLTSATATLASAQISAASPSSSAGASATPEAGLTASSDLSPTATPYSSSASLVLMDASLLVLLATLTAFR